MAKKVTKVTRKKAMIEALEKSLGVVTTACKIVGIARKTHYEWLGNDDKYRQQVEDIKNIAIDFAESQLHKRMKGGSDTALIFFLKTQGKGRGYSEKHIEEPEKPKDKAIIIPPMFATPAQQEIFEAINSGTIRRVGIKKGRRFGFTHSIGMLAIDKMFLGEWSKVLWGDTVAGNLTRYYDRYFKPRLDKVVGKGNYKFNRSDKQLTITDCNGNDAVMDMRSAERPENWEGFGYDAIILNEAGIILDNPYLYKNAVAPMLLDNPNSILIAGGVPKGKTNKQGQKHTFLELVEQFNKDEKSTVFEFDTYSNPMLSKSDIDKLVDDLGGIDSPIVQQEIFAQFVDDFELIFLDRFSDENISIEAVYNPNYELHLSFDFNIINSCTAWQYYDDKIVCIKEYHEAGKDLQELCADIQTDFPKADFRINGDATGKAGSALTSGNLSAYELIQNYMDLGVHDFSTALRSVNPSHKSSRIFCNAMVKQKQTPVLIHPSCVKLIRDCKLVKFESKNGKMLIVKTDESLTHMLDTMRYYLHQEHSWLVQELGINDFVE